MSTNVLMLTRTGKSRWQPSDSKRPTRHAHLHGLPCSQLEEFKAYYSSHIVGHRRLFEVRQCTSTLISCADLGCWWADGHQPASSARHLRLRACSCVFDVMLVKPQDVYEMGNELGAGAFGSVLK